MKINFAKSASALGLNIFLSAKNKENDIWQQNTLSVGNGMLGGSIYGEIFNERVIFNEKTLWNVGIEKRKELRYTCFRVKQWIPGSTESGNQ